MSTFVYSPDKMLKLRRISIESKPLSLPALECVYHSNSAQTPEHEYKRRVAQTVNDAKQSACPGMETKQVSIMGNQKLQIQPLEQAAHSSLTDAQRVIRNYRKLKKSDIRKSSINLSDRHRYFEKMDQEKVAAARKIVLNGFLTDQEKCSLIPKALGLKYDMKLQGSNLCSMKGPKLYSFELINTEYDCFIVGEGEQFYDSVYQYFLTMLNFEHLRLV
ncbi:uncharacterized protein LOC129720643 [Wyeomyia smithii]|uniref:uncharacterized protein LOC129720643 n=1 Tax=Wyeomyia smithii TaxID=174621 RepID=UPI002467DA5D|nr:uncharacterized protein LOC129720643 [Wyeomyia smithii]